MGASQSTDTEILCIYASEDKNGFEELKDHLYNFREVKDIIRAIPPGKPALEERNRLINQARLIIILVSPDLLSSQEQAVSMALGQASDGKAQIIPILYRPVNLEGSGLADLQLLPHDGKAIKESAHRDQIWANIAGEIKKTWQELVASAPSAVGEKARTAVNVSQTAPKQAQEQDPTRPATVFISSAGDARKNREQLELMLRLRGLKIWHRDSEDLPFLGSREKVAERAVSELADAYLLYLTPEALKKPQLWLPEARAALQRHEQTSEFPIVLILQGVSQKRVQIALEKVSLGKLSDFVWEELQSQSDSRQGAVDQALRRLARRILREAFLQRQRRARAGTDYTPFIGITHFLDRETTRRLDLELDWYDFFQGKGRLPSEQEWNTWLWPALADLKELLSKHTTARTLYLALKAIIPVGFAIGLMFKEPTGFKLAVKNSGPASTEAVEEKYWHTVLPESDIQQVRLIDSYNPGGDPSTAVVEIAISPPFGPQVITSYLDLNGISYGYRQRYEIRTEKKSIGEQEAQSMMYEIRKGLRLLPQRFGPAGEHIKHIHLFAAMPIALAVMVGYQLNTLVPITVYEYRSPQGYLPACVLDNSRSST
ncbi:MAG: SAVED domain-containing protein [Thermogemmatispora sp.]|uniref:SAVED domain-containing protein n=1 Tax=Thermogemmatispora sp. TaxID=1968838 RepID=UPI002633B3D5|nr:SAVED domain-containing protein [Thermogemmatispora sp.]MBX5459020.1 SAVED domain-containing protein [Thermogemmatispora sp.]